MKEEWPRLWTWQDETTVLARALDRGEMLVIPTESTYGLAVDPLSEIGVATVCRFKGRPPGKALPVVLGEVGQLARLGADPMAPELTELAALWPAPLTVVLELERPIPASAGRSSLAVRVPAHQRLRSLLRTLDRPLTATSANLAGQTPVTETRMVLQMLSEWPCFVIDDGNLPGGEVSTIVQISGDGYRLLRHGAVAPEWIRDRVSRPLFSAAPAEIPVDDPSYPL